MAQQQNNNSSPTRPAGDRPHGLPNFYPPNTNTAGPAYNPAPTPHQYGYHQPPPPYHQQQYAPHHQPQYAPYNMPPGGQYYAPMHPQPMDPAAANNNNNTYMHAQPSAPPMRKSPTNSIDSNIRSIDNAIQGIRGGGSIGGPNQPDTRSAGAMSGIPSVPGYPNMPYNNNNNSSTNGMRPMGAGMSSGSSYGADAFEYPGYYAPNVGMPNAGGGGMVPNVAMAGVRGMPMPMGMNMGGMVGGMNPTTNSGMGANGNTNIANRGMMLPPGERARQAFVDADKDKSGYITFSEFLESLTNLNMKIPYVDALALFSHLDADKDGRVVESEFVNGYLRDGLGARRNNNNNHHHHHHHNNNNNNMHNPQIVYR